MKLSLLLAAGASAFALDARFGDRDVAKTPTLGAFCAKMTDSMYENGAANPTQKIAYDLCLDTSKASWSRTETDGSKQIYNGSHLFTLDNASHCKVVVQAPDTSAMPFTMPVVDDGAAKNGTATVDGVAVTVYHIKRAAKHSGSFFQPAEDMYWFVRDDDALVQSECVIAKQDGYPMSTKAYHDYFARGAYEATVPADAFDPPAGADCVMPGHMVERDASKFKSCAGCVDTDGVKCCAESNATTPYCLKTTSCESLPAFL